MDEIRVDSVKAYLDKVNEITKQKPGKYIFRGQCRNKEDNGNLRELNCGATRRIRDFIDRQPTNEDLRNYHQKLIYYAKQRRYNIKDGSNLSDLEIIADLQHFGSATMLIDFTKSALVALYFASIDDPDKDGAVFMINQEDDIFENAFDAMLTNKDDVNSFVLWGKLLGENPNKLFYWEPSSLNQRIPAQHSIFVFGQPEIKTNTIRITIEKHTTIRYYKKKGKKAITEELEKIFDINAITLFNDLPGFAWSNRFTTKLESDFLEFKTKDQENFQKEQSEKQLEEYDKIDLNDNNKYDFFEKAKLNYDLKFYDKAIKYLTKAIEIDPNFSAAYNNRGIVKNNLDRYEEAINDYNKAIEIDPKYAAAYNNRGIAKNNLGRYEDALEDCDETIRLDPKSTMGYINRGNAKKGLGHNMDAIKDYDKALTINPKSSIAYNNRGIAKKNLGLYKEAIKDYNIAIELDPKDSDAYNNRGNAKVSLGFHQEAIKDWLKASKLFLEKQRYSYVIKCHNAIYKIDKMNSLSYLYSSIAQWNLGEKEKSKPDYDKAKELATKQDDKQILKLLEECFNEDGSLKDNWKEAFKKQSDNSFD